jgi:MFS family permease
VVLVLLGCLVCQMGLGFGYVFGPLAPDIIGELGWTRTAYSSARAPQLFVIALASPVVGALTMRLGARRVLTAAVVALGLAFVALSGLVSLWQLYALVMLQGVAVAGLGDITVGHVVSQWVVRHRGLALGVVYTGSNRGLALGVVYTGSNLVGALLTRLAAGIAELDSWRTAFLTIGLGGLVAMLPCALWLVREPPFSSESDSFAGAPRDGGDLDLRAARRTRSFWVLAFSLFTFFFYFIGMLEHLVLFLTDVGIPRGEATAHFSNAILLGMVSKVGLGFIADRVPRRAAMLLDYGLLAVSSLLLLALPNAALLPVFVATYGFATAARDVVTPLMVVECFGTRYLAQIYGALMLVLLPGGALGPIFAAAVHDGTGSYEPAFVGFAVLNLLAVGSLFLLRRESRGIDTPAPGEGT